MAQQSQPTLSKRGTPIDQLPPVFDSGSGGGQQDLVGNIVRDYEQSGSGLQDPVSQTELVSNDQFERMQRTQQQAPPMRDQVNTRQQVEYFDEPEYYEEVEEIQEVPKTTGQLLVDHLKLPLLVAVLVYLSNMRVVNLYLMRYVPKMANRLGGLSQLGLVVKALLFGVVFYVVSRYLL